MPNDIDPSHQLQELRRVLVKPDLIVEELSPQTLEQLRLELLTAEILVERLTPHLAAMLAEQAARSPEAVARSIAPVIGEAIRRQVYHARSREDIVDALYPVVGQMINRAVRESLSDLARGIDSRVRQSLRLPWQQRPAARLGISEAEYQLRAALPFAVHELFLIQRSSGLLICHAAQAAAGPDRDLVSGMLTAIRDFARDSFGQGEPGELGAIEYESRRIVLEAGSAAYLAAVVDGVEPVGFREDMRQALISLHEGSYERLRAFDGSDAALVESARLSLGALLRQHAPLPPAPQEPPAPQIPEPARAAAPATAPAARRPRAVASVGQRAILALGVLLCLAPLLACGWWAWQTEMRVSALAAAPTSQPASMDPPPAATPMPAQPAAVAPTALAAPAAPPTAEPAAPPTAAPAPSAIPPTAAPAATTTPTPAATAARATVLGEMVGNVFLRDSPTLTGVRSAVVAPRGARVEVLDRSVDGEWYRIRALLTDRAEVEASGWVLARWVRLLPPQAP